MSGSFIICFFINSFKNEYKPPNGSPTTKKAEFLS